VVSPPLATAAKEFVQVGFHLGPINAIRLTRDGAHRCRVADRFARRQSTGAAPRLHRALGYKLGVALEGSETLEVLRGQRGTVGRDHPGVLTWQAEADPCLAVGEHG